VRRHGRRPDRAARRREEEVHLDGSPPTVSSTWRRDLRLGGGLTFRFERIAARAEREHPIAGRQLEGDAAAHVVQRQRRAIEVGQVDADRAIRKCERFQVALPAHADDAPVMRGVVVDTGNGVASGCGFRRRDDCHADDDELRSRSRRVSRT
jgi:hypothetical protein